MKKKIFSCIFIFFIIISPARADMFGGDTLYLAQILSNAIQQLAQLKSILQSGQDNLSLLREINRGINDSLMLLKTISPNVDPGIYKNWQTVSDALKQVESIYGAVSASGESRVQRDADQQVAEAVKFNNSIYEYTREIDQLGEVIKNQSHLVSPGGAAKLTAQTLGVMLHIQNETLRANATGLKLQAQAMAIQNRKDKLLTKNIIQTSEFLKSAMENQNPRFSLPRF